MRIAIILIAALLSSAAVAQQAAEVAEMARQIVPKVAIDSDEEFFAAWNLDYLYEAGERILAHRFEAGGFTVQFTDGIDWNYFPKTLPDGNSIPITEISALRIAGSWGVDIYLNDLRQDEIGPPNGMLKRAAEVETDARAAVVRRNEEGEVIRASAVGASHLTVAGVAPSLR